MANQLKDLSDGDIHREILAEFHNSLTFLKTINNQYDSSFGKEGRKNGGTLLIRNPNEYVVTDGKVLVTQEADETTQSFTVATRKHVGMPSFSSLERTMQVDEYRTRFARPAMLRLASYVENDILSTLYKDIFNIVGTVDTTPAELLDIRRAGARLSKCLAPRSDRTVLLNADAMSAVTNSMNTYFHANKELEKSFMDGYIGHAAGFDWLESEMIPNHTNGTRTDTTPVVNTSTGITSGTATITTTGGSSGTLNVGDTFTVGEVYMVNRETKERQSELLQFVVTTADTDASGTNVISVSPTPVTSGARQNCEIVNAGSGKAVLNLTGGGSGAAGLVWPQNMAYHKDAFTFVTGDLHVEPGQRMTVDVIEGISMRVWHGSDFVNDEFGTRVDVLYGAKTLRPEWATRIRS